MPEPGPYPGRGPGLQATPPRALGLLVPLVLIALGLRVAAVLLPLLPAPTGYEDVHVARHLARGEGFTLDPALGPTAIKAPLYPAVLALLLRVAGEAGFPVAAGLVNAVLGAAAVALTGRLAARLFGARAGLAAGAILALLPAHVQLTRVLESTNLSVPLAAAAALAWLRSSAPSAGGRVGAAAARGPAPRTASADWGDAAVAGAVTGLTGLSNPLALAALAPAAALAILGPGVFAVGSALSPSVSPARSPRRLRSAAAAGAAMTLVLLPWTLRNAVAFGRLVPVKSCFWLNVYFGLLPECLDGRTPFPADRLAWLEEAARGKGDYEREALYRDTLVPWMRSNPGTVLRLSLWRAGQYLGLYGERASGSPAVDLLLRRTPAVGLLALTALGAWRGFRVCPRAVVALLALLAVYTAMHAVTVAVNGRYATEVAWAKATLASALAAGRRRVLPRAANGGGSAG